MGRVIQLPIKSRDQQQAQTEGPGQVIPFPTKKAPEVPKIRGACALAVGRLQSALHLTDRELNASLLEFIDNSHLVNPTDLQLFLAESVPSPARADRK